MQINKEHEFEMKPMRKTQANWIDHFNKKKLKMISAPDIYAAIKKKDKVVESLKKDLVDDFIMTSTRLSKKGIIHDAGSKIVKPKTINVEIPDYSGTFEHDKKAEKFLQALFDTKDNISKIVANLKSIYADKDIFLWTPSRLGSNDFRAVGLCFDGDRFDVCCYDWVDDSGGLSRGVKINSAPKEQGKGGSK